MKPIFRRCCTWLDNSPEQNQNRSEYRNEYLIVGVLGSAHSKICLQISHSIRDLTSFSGVLHATCSFFIRTDLSPTPSPGGRSVRPWREAHNLSPCSSGQRLRLRTRKPAGLARVLHPWSDHCRYYPADSSWACHLYCTHKCGHFSRVTLTQNFGQEYNSYPAFWTAFS